MYLLIGTSCKYELVDTVRVCSCFNYQNEIFYAKMHFSFSFS